MNVLVGLFVFTLGLGLVVFPIAVAEFTGRLVGRRPEDSWVSGIRGVGLLAMLAGFALLIR